MDEMEMMAKRKALESIRGLAGEAMGNRLKAMCAPPPEAAPAEEMPVEPEMEDEDARRLIELYESRREE